MSFAKRVRLARYPRELPEQWRGAAVAIGNFDGIHLGHKAVLGTLEQVAGDRPRIALSFYPHPIRVLRGGDEPRCLSSVREKAERLAELKVQLLYLIHFTKSFSQLSARSFIEQVLVRALGATAIVVGEDVAVGQGREGNLEFLKRELPNYGITLHVVPRFELAGVRTGSRTIRDLVGVGDMRAAAHLMGSPFTISARVGHGDKRGSMIGYPTANIAVGKRLIPKRGVYACYVEVLGASYKGVANIGTRPTFNGRCERLEVHILDIQARSLYGCRMHVSFIERLRDEERFGSVEELKAQIGRDVETARRSLTDV